MREGFSFFLANSHNRGDAGAEADTATPGVGSSSTSGVTTMAAAASETPKRLFEKSLWQHEKVSM